MRQAIINARIFTGENIVEGEVLVIDNGKIETIQSTIPAEATIIDLKGNNISAGCIDIQINGGFTHYFTKSPTEETLHDICDSSLHFGTTHVLPCLISSSLETILTAIETVKNFMQRYPQKGVLGMHLEGPFLNPLKRGAHLAKFVRQPTNDELQQIILKGRGVIKVMTIAPECFTNEQIDMLLDSGIVISAGHSTMDYKQAQQYFSKGISLITHLYNAMTQMGHREPGMVGAVLDNDSVYAPIILDGGHCDYAAARIAYKAKKEKLFLISDAAFLGRRVKEFSWGEFDTILVDEFYRNKEGNLAGAAISMQEAVQNAMQHLYISLEEALKMATVRVAKAIKMEATVGKIQPGYPAHFIQFNNDFSQVESMLF
jgi:N-acetylglucosamine-6-phosphate deacetylase